MDEKNETFLSMPENNLIIHEYATAITYISFSIYVVHTVDSMLFRVDIGGPFPALETRYLKESPIIPVIDLFK